MIWWNSPIGWGPLSSALRAACGARGPRHPLPINNRRLISNQWWMWAVGGGPHSACFGFFLGLFLSTNRWRPRQVEQQWNVAPASGLGFGFLGFGFWGVFFFFGFFLFYAQKTHSFDRIGTGPIRERAVLELGATHNRSNLVEEPGRTRLPIEKKPDGHLARLG